MCLFDQQKIESQRVKLSNLEREHEGVVEQLETLKPLPEKYEELSKEKQALEVELETRVRFFSFFSFFPLFQLLFLSFSIDLLCEKNEECHVVTSQWSLIPKARETFKDNTRIK